MTTRTLERKLFALSLASGSTAYVIHRSLDAAIEFALLANKIKEESEVVFAADCTGSFLLGRMGDTLRYMLNQPRVGLVRQTIKNPVEGHTFTWGLCQYDSLSRDNLETPVDTEMRKKPKPVTVAVSMKQLEAI